MLRDTYIHLTRDLPCVSIPVNIRNGPLYLLHSGIIDRVDPLQNFIDVIFIIVTDLSFNA